MSNPKQILSKLDQLVTAWRTLAPEKSFGGMTLEQFKALIKASYDSRERIETLEDQLQSEQSGRDDADKESLRLLQMVVNGIKGDLTEGPDSDLYEAAGYVRESEKKSGLTRKSKTPAKG